MKNKKVLLQNMLIILPFIHLLIINLFQIRKSELLKLSLFAVCYLFIFNLVKYFLKNYSPFKNSDFFAVIFFYLSFNYSDITIYIYFQAFDVLGFIPNYSFLTFTLLLIMLLIISTKNGFDKLFEFGTITYLVFILIISFNSININQEENDIDLQSINLYEKIELTDRPDVYFVIFDGLPSLETMEKYYDYETDKFYNLLNKNHLISHNLSSSSFGRTTYTMASLLNMEYIFQNGEIPFPKRNDLSKSFKSGDSKIENILRNNNYSLYKFGLAFNCNSTKEDVCITESIENYKEKDSVYFDLITRTPLKILIEKGILKLNPSLSIGCKDGCSDPELNEIFSLINQEDQPKAVFLHFMDTHGPYLLGENCELLENPLFDLPKTDVVTYRKSLDCAYSKIETLLKNLNLNKDIIFIQSDHGPNFEKEELTNISELSTNQILNRYSTFSVSNLQNFCASNVGPVKSSINTFVRFINCFSAQEIALLEVKNFLAFGKVNESVFDISDLVQKAIYENYK